MKDKIYELLSGRDLRSISRSNEVIKLIKTQEEFDILFEYLFDENRLIVMRAADSIEKITKDNEYLDKHKTELLKLLDMCRDIELKWHLALVISRINLNIPELENVYLLLKKWVLDKDESKIVRVNSLQTLFEISRENNELEKDFLKIVKELKKENISSLNARIKKIEK